MNVTFSIGISERKKILVVAFMVATKSYKGKILKLSLVQFRECDQSNLLWLIFDSFPDLLHALKELGKNFGQISNHFLRICRPPYLSDAQKKKKVNPILFYTVKIKTSLKKALNSGKSSEVLK